MTRSTIRVRLSFHEKFMQNQLIWWEGDFFGGTKVRVLFRMWRTRAWTPYKNPKSLSSPKAEKFDFLRFWGCRGFRGGVSGEFLGYHRCGEYSEWGEQMGLRSLWIPKVSIKSQSEKIDFFYIFGRLGGHFVDYL